MIAKRVLLALAAALVWSVPAVSAQYAGGFARMGMGARSVTVAGQVADFSGSASPYLNPALAPFQSGQAIELSTGIFSFDRQWQALQVGAPLKPKSGIAAGLIRGGVSNIDGRDLSGYHTDTYSTSEFAFFVAFGTRFTERVSGGIGMRVYRSDVFQGVTPPTALGISLGLATKITPKLSAGLVVDDLFARYEWNTSAAGGSTATDNFPTRITGGAAYSLGALPSGAPRGVVSADLEWGVQRAETVRPNGIDVIGSTPVERDTTLSYRLASVQGRLGGEFWLADAFALRGGVDRLGAGDLGEARPALGFAVKQRFGDLDARLDYAAVLEPYGTGILHMATVRFGL